MAEDNAAGRDGAATFTPHERRTIAAAMARIIPTDEHPGAAEAGTIDFVERYLSGTDFIYAKPDGSGFEVLTGKRAEAWQRRVATMLQKYRDGIRELDSRSRHRFGRDFADCGAEEQDAVLRAVEARETWPDTTLTPAYEVASVVAGGPALQQTATEVGLDFFPLLVVHTRQGFLADPVYGGNRDHVGWQSIGFPGPRSMAEVHQGRFSSLAWFAEGHTDPSAEKRETHHGT
jgi:gluconate 2-dehydrogenase gamma chain